MTNVTCFCSKFFNFFIESTELTFFLLEESQTYSSLMALVTTQYKSYKTFFTEEKYLRLFSLAKLLFFLPEIKYFLYFGLDTNLLVI